MDLHYNTKMIFSSKQQLFCCCVKIGVYFLNNLNTKLKL